MIHLVINGKFIGAFASLYACWKPLDDAYNALPEQYETTIDWRVTKADSGEYIDGENMPAGLWFVVAENAKAFNLYLKIGGWSDKYSEVPAHLDGLLEYGSNYE